MLAASRRVFVPRAMELTVTSTDMVDNADATNTVVTTAGTTVIADPDITGGYVLKFTNAAAKQATTSVGFAMPSDYTVQVTFKVNSISNHTSVLHIPGNLMLRHG